MSSHLDLGNRIPGSIDISRRGPIYTVLPYRRFLRDMSGSHTLRNDKEDRPEPVSPQNRNGTMEHTVVGISCDAAPETQIAVTKLSSLFSGLRLGPDSDEMRLQYVVCGSRLRLCC